MAKKSIEKAGLSREDLASIFGVPLEKNDKDTDLRFYPSDTFGRRRKPKKKLVDVDLILDR